MTDQWVVPWLLLLGGWSLRWAFILAATAGWFAVRPPRRPNTCYRVCLAALGAGLLLPLTPQWGAGLLTSQASGIVPRLVSGRVSSSEATPPGGGPLPTASTPRSHASISTESRFDRTGNLTGMTAMGSMDPKRVAILAVGVLWAFPSLVMAIRLIGGWRMLARLRRDATELTGSSGLLGECRAALALERPVRLAAHPLVATPVILGGLRPLVLVPEDWAQWPDSRRRACLLHELCHLARLDDMVKLAQELIRIPFFFHPLVAWLLIRLDRERELICDEAAVAHGCDPVDYVRLLVELARRRSRLPRTSPGLRPGWLPFLDRRTVRARIERLLEGDARTPSPASSGRPIAPGALAVLVAVAVGGIRVSARPVPEPDPVEYLATAPGPLAADADEPARPKELRGIVVDSEDRPVEGATVVAGCADPGRSGHQVLATDAQGRFTWKVPERSEMVGVFAHKSGMSAATWLDWMGSPTARPEQRLKLGKSEPFEAVLLNGQGGPIVGAKLRIKMVAHSFASGNTVTTWYEHVAGRVVEGSVLEPLYAATTGPGGSLRFDGVAPGSGLAIHAIGPDGRTFLVRHGTEPAESARQGMARQGFVDSPPGSRTKLVAVPSARITGRVVSKLPRVGVAGLVITQGVCHFPERPPSPLQFADEVRTDAEGRFVLDGLDEGAVNVYVHGAGENETWTYRAAKEVRLTPGSTSEVKLELIRGVEVEGMVVEQGTGRPIDKVEVGVIGPHRPRSGSAVMSATTDGRGRYRYRQPAGETYLYVMGHPDGYDSLPDGRSTRTLVVPEGAPQFKAPSIELIPPARGTGQEEAAE
ncbi:M56 family metallopeptidase [Aquisphaera giovannonii]|nr:M56 family metallopeptidase [Aquisphaera giovannonii]